MGWWSSRQTAEAHSKEHSRSYCASSGGYVEWTECSGTSIIRLLSSWYPRKCHRSLRWSGSDSHRVITLDIQSATQFSCSGHCVWFVSIFICLTTMFIRSHLFQIMTSLSCSLILVMTCVHHIVVTSPTAGDGQASLQVDIHHPYCLFSLAFPHIICSS